MAEEWAIKELVDDDYLQFYASVLTDEASDAQAELVWRLLDLTPGASVLDLACGHGRIANRLAAPGATVTGLDTTPLFLEHARADAAQRGVTVATSNTREPANPGDSPARDRRAKRAR